MALVRLLLVFVGAVAQNYAFTPPNIPPPEQLREQRGSEPLLFLLVLVLRVLVWSWVLLEGLVIFALSGYIPSTLAQPLLHALLPTTFTSDPTVLTPAFLAGIALTLSGAFLRAHCFRALGPRFTFELSLRPAHALVTDGVYSIVRHPSYTGFTAIGIGYLLCTLDRQGPIVSVWGKCLLAAVGLFAEAGTGDATVTGVLACLWAAGLSALYAVSYGRMNREDAMLESEFGDEWRAWAKRVPRRMVPGVY